MIWSPMVKLGLSEVIGSWKIIASRLPRRSRRVCVGHVEQIEAVEADRAGDLGRLLRQQPHDGERGHALAAAGFADEAERRAVGDAEIDAVDRVRGAAVVAMEDDAQALDLDQRDVRSFLGPRSPASMPASMVARSVIPAGFLRRRQELAEMHPALAADRFEPLELGKRIGMVVDAQVEVGPFLLAVDQKRRRLLAALVAAGGFAGLHRRDQALCERQRLRWRHRPSRCRRARRRRPACCRRSRSRRPATCPHQSTQSRPVCAAMRPPASMMCSCRLSRPSSAAIRVSTISRGAASLAQQLQAVDAVIGIDQRLRRDAADAGGDMRHARADGEELGRDRDAELAGGVIAGDDRPGHLCAYRPAA